MLTSEVAAPSSSMGGLIPGSPSLLHTGLSFRLLLLVTAYSNILFENPPPDFHLAVHGVLISCL